MYDNQNVRAALRHAAIITANVIAVPVGAGISLILLDNLSRLFCEQLTAMMMLTAVITALMIAIFDQKN